LGSEDIGLIWFYISEVHFDYKRIRIPLEESNNTHLEKSDITVLARGTKLAQAAVHAGGSCAEGGTESDSAPQPN